MLLEALLNGFNFYFRYFDLLKWWKLYNSSKRKPQELHSTIDPILDHLDESHFGQAAILYTTTFRLISCFILD